MDFALSEFTTKQRRHTYVTLVLHKMKFSADGGRGPEICKSPASGTIMAKES